MSAGRGIAVAWMLAATAGGCTEPRPHRGTSRVHADATSTTTTPAVPRARPGPFTHGGGATWDPWIDVAAGSVESCGLRASGRIACWGALDEVNLDIPEGAFVQISMISFGACALDRSGAITCWGCANPRPCDPPPLRFDLLYPGGAAHFCAREAATGSVHCWGSPAADPPGDPRWPLVFSGGNERSCLIPRPGELPVCWGSSWWEDYPWAMYPPDGVVFTDLALGSTHGCGLDEAGEVVCWGAVGLDCPGPPEVCYPPCPFAGPFTDIVTANRWTCVRDPQGVWQCWGPDGPAWPPLDPPPVPYVKVDVGDFHACGLTADGHIDCFGDDWGYGELTPPP